MNLTDDFSEFVQLLLKNKAEFLVVGGVINVRKS